MMNKLMCFLSGGHRYADKNLKTELIPDDIRHVIISNECVKCGNAFVFIMDVNAQIKHDMSVSKGGEG